MTENLRWGILSSAKIARTKVIPAIVASSGGQVAALASRDLSRASHIAEEMGISRCHASYQALLDDPDIDIVYNPLPNSLHLEWSLKALAAGKHLLCEKPFTLNATQMQSFIDAKRQYPHLCVMEGFMYRFHPQWRQVKTWLKEDRIGPLRALQSVFAYNNRDGANIRNRRDVGGGALLDIGCYGISSARHVFAAEPQRVMAQLHRAPDYEVDTQVNAWLDFGDGRSAHFTCSTKSEPGQQLSIEGERGRIVMTTPFTPQKEEHSEIQLISQGQQDLISVRATDQYQCMVEHFHNVIGGRERQAISLEDSVANQRVIDGLFASAEQHSAWVNL